MAERRMFAKSIISSDVFLSMPISTQCLYFHLSMRADDEGFIDSPRTIMRMVGATDDDMNVLISKKYVLLFDSGVIVIKHWKIHNYIQNDRFKKTSYFEEKSMLGVDKKNAYIFVDNQECIQNGYKMDTQVRLGKDSIDKDNINNTTTTAEKEDTNKVKNDVYDTLQQYIPEANPIWIDYIESFEKQGLKQELIIYAIKETASKGIRSASYFKEICKSYLDNGYKTLEEIENAKCKYKNKKNSKNNKTKDNNTKIEPKTCISLDGEV